MLFRGGRPAVSRTMAVSAAAGEQSTLEVVPSMSPRDEAIFLLHTAAEIEHVLMAQYLYAAWSLPLDGPAVVQRWRRDILQIAREEMAHFASVQNLLRFIGGPLNFDREDFPFRTDFYPFPFRLEPLSRTSLAHYIAAEMPAEPDVDPSLIEEVLRLATGNGNGQPVNRVGALYNRLTTLFADEQKLPNGLFRPDTADGIQALPARYRADVGRGPLYLRSVRNRDEALSLLADIASQGEGEENVPRSHFLVFVGIFDAWPAADEGAPSLNVSTHPNTSTDSGSDDLDLAGGRITHPHAAVWASVFNQHYRMLLTWLQHALLSRTRDPASSGLSLRAFAEMLVLSDVGGLLTALPRTENGSGRAGAPFELPYSLAFPDLTGDRWDYHWELVASARAQIDALSAASETEEAIRQRVLSSIAAAEAFIEEQASDREDQP
ncbi:MAG TPA: ferritin-like domain-containing protein [Pseudonocardiaceae bacterium]|nr:ferritin-like domain-containing protein [Pseudonocardiaceae bacterium]